MLSVYVIVLKYFDLFIVSISYILFIYLFIYCCIVIFSALIKISAGAATVWSSARNAGGRFIGGNK